MIDPTLPARNLAERLPDLGLKVEKVVYGPYQRAEIEISQGDLMKGDVGYGFRMNEANAKVRARCPLLRVRSFMQSCDRFGLNDVAAGCDALCLEARMRDVMANAVGDPLAQCAAAPRSMRHLTAEFLSTDAVDRQANLCPRLAVSPWLGSVFLTAPKKEARSMWLRLQQTCIVLEMNALAPKWPLLCVF